MIGLIKKFLCSIRGHGGLHITSSLPGAVYGRCKKCRKEIHISIGSMRHDR